MKFSKCVFAIVLSLFVVVSISACSSTPSQSPICPAGEYLDRWSTCKPIPPVVDHNKNRKQ